MVRPGIETLIADPYLLKGKRVGLIANASSVDKGLFSSVDLLQNHPDIHLTTLFGAQQGFCGETQDNMIEWQSGRYPRYGLPLYSLYGDTRKPTLKMLEDIDILVCDLQDVGTRVYTFIWTMALAMQACAESGKGFVVCDRPNPINGINIEGNVSAGEFSSFVALYPLPMRHGMTAGEIANYINDAYNIGCDLTVVKMDGWRRPMWWDETGLPWVIPSANMPTVDTATVYPGMVIFEGTNVSEGRGTTRPFEFVGAPFIDGFRLAEELAGYDLPGIRFRPCIFIPTFHKYAGRNCGGLQLHVTNRTQFKPFKTAMAILKTVRDVYPDDFKWKEPPYEYVYDRPPVDVILGCDWVRRSLEEGRVLEEIIGKTNSELEKFDKIRRGYLLY